jgi:hypothetical protein
MNRLATIIEMADDAVKMTPDDLHRFVMRILRRLDLKDLQIVQIEHDIEQAKKL